MKINENGRSLHRPSRRIGAAIVTARGAEVSLLGWMNLAFRLTARPLVALEVSHQNTLLQRSHRKQVAVSIDYEKIYFRELHVAKEG